MTLRPPTSTLFPYTTLFRSSICRLRAARCPSADDKKRRSQKCPAVHASGEDRKSTRLNSSHVRISYAVFCLKKKTRAVERRWMVLRQCPRNRGLTVAELASV